MSSLRRALTVSVALALSTAIAAPAAAQLAGKRHERRGQQQQQQQKAPAATYPNATRQDPKERASQKGVKELQTLSKLNEEGKNAELLARAVPFAESTSNAYEKSFSWLLSGSAAIESDDLAKAAQYFKAAIDANGLDNNNHYNAMYNLAVVYSQLEQNEAALAMLERFLSETRTDDPKYLNTKAQLLAAAGRHEEAAKLFLDSYGKDPSDKRLLMNAVASLQQAEKFAEAGKLMQEARSKGLLTEAREYRALYSGLLNEEKWREAATVIEEGVAKGILAQDADLGKAWGYVAQGAYFSEPQDLDAAAKYYTLAAPLSANGEAWLNLAKIYQQQGKSAQMREAAKQAQAKGGLKNPGEASRLANQK
ncbi:tetratricopeptide repeat protein [Solilutibacter pythonis]|nr:tetratricopeptide repeat protein [Lysobacter pythonis]